MEQTVFILGAGASHEVGLPIGEGLTKSIAKLCNIRLARGLREIGDQELYDTLRSTPGDINPKIQAARKIYEGMPLAASIDNFLDAHRTDEHIQFVGKLAIVRAILDAERESRLFRDPLEARPLDMTQVGANWFVWFWRLLCDGCGPDEISKRGSSVSFVVFNYDRCLEQFLLFAARAYYGLADLQSAAQTVKNIRIFHPYGSLGPLSWQSNRPVEYGVTEIGPQQLVEVSKGLKTFTESTQPGGEIDELRAVVHAADRLVFLGFAYHRQNMRLLWPGNAPSMRSYARQAYGTAKDLSESDMKLIKADIAQMAGIDPPQITLRDLTCSNLFHEYSRSLSLA